MDIRQEEQYGDYLEKTGWTVERIDNTNYFIKRFWVFGSFIKIQRPENIDIQIINKLIKKYRAFQILIEPSPSTDYQILPTRFGFRQTSPYLPSKTIVLNLAESKEKLLKKMRKNTRYAIKHNKSSLQIDPNLEKFRKAWKKTVGWKRHVPSLKNLKSMQETFGENVLFLLDKKSGSGAIFLKTKDTAYYWQAFTDKQGRKNNAQYKIVWQGILWAKKVKCKSFDFEGVYDNRFPDKTWKGFSFFKKGFGGKIKKYPGAFTKSLLLNSRLKRRRHESFVQ